MSSEPSSPMLSLRRVPRLATRRLVRALWTLVAGRAGALAPAGDAPDSAWSEPLAVSEEPVETPRPTVLGRLKLRPAPPPGEG